MVYTGTWEWVRNYSKQDSESKLNTVVGPTVGISPCLWLCLSTNQKLCSCPIRQWELAHPKWPFSHHPPSWLYMLVELQTHWHHTSCYVTVALTVCTVRVKTWRLQDRWLVSMDGLWTEVSWLTGNAVFTAELSVVTQINCITNLLWENKTKLLSTSKEHHKRRMN